MLYVPVISRIGKPLMPVIRHGRERLLAKARRRAGLIEGYVTFRC
jgi:hypothetical protein